MEKVKKFTLICIQNIVTGMVVSEVVQKWISREKLQESWLRKWSWKIANLVMESHGNLFPRFCWNPSLFRPTWESTERRRLNVIRGVSLSAGVMLLVNHEWCCLSQSKKVRGNQSRWREVRRLGNQAPTALSIDSHCFPWMHWIV